MCAPLGVHGGRGLGGPVVMPVPQPCANYMTEPAQGRQGSSKRVSWCRTTANLRRAPTLWLLLDWSPQTIELTNLKALCLSAVSARLTIQP